MSFRYLRLLSRPPAIACIILLSTIVLIAISASFQAHSPRALKLGPRASTYEGGIVQYDNASLLLRRDEYTCYKGVPCKQDACCGSFQGTNQGVCGLGPTFCGSDCDSKCNAKAECGAGADPPGKTCPLNVCCSQYGFCGSTEQFCTKGCQSNCVVSPAVPPGKSSKKVLDNKVIGYYEAWAARSNCHGFAPYNIPTDGLTHVNFAFAFIDPSTLQVVPMDSDTPGGLFADATDIKSIKTGNSGLQVFVSIGGWTFSDNGTATQPLLSQISADSAKRRKFADNLVAFMVRYGFDGVDIDWEYPGAPDRGGLGSYDVVNFVELMKTLRGTFQTSSRGNYGLTFTIPSSYWYLRWFNVPELLKYADWTNLMSYDLHGTWDASNPIGSIVQAHTNLTEIKYAMDLLWRNNVRPEQVVLGLGFYGRSFQLADKGCSSPGCAFKGPADAGSCTANPGTLAYFEIMDVIARDKPSVIHDSTSAVKYFTYGANQDQWISYDDKETFKSKLDWADSVGLGGIMIWSVDQDDSDFSALEGLLGRSLSSFANEHKRRQRVDVNHWTALNGQGCVVTDCEDEDWQPPPGFTIVPNGKYRDTCSALGKARLKNVYCPSKATPSTCVWRGEGSCHGQCLPGEVTLAHSPYGDKQCLNPGMQALCCVSNTWSRLIQKCAWANKCDDCPSDSHFLVSSRPANLLTCEKQSFCCPYNFENCHWVGKGTCDDNECGATDVQVALDDYGDNWYACGAGLNGRQKSLCCNAPKDLNFFLPAALEDLFPTLPPVDYIPAFEQSTISSLPNPAPSANSDDGFFLVVIDGPASAVTNLNKREGSHLEFVTGPVHLGQATQNAYYVCMDDTTTSNCDDVHLDGIDGTIIRLPDHLGFAQWGVAHAVRPSNYSLPRDLLPHAPKTAQVMELEYSYDFSKVKRASGDIYLRVDYSDDGKYYKDVVTAKHQKRDVERRFWSKALDTWKAVFNSIRQRSGRLHKYLSLVDQRVNVLIYGDDGRRSNCGNSDGWLSVRYAGSLSASMEWGFTMVGTISPVLKLEEAYGYFDSHVSMSGQLKFDGKGYLSMSPVSGVQRKLLSSAISRYGASHPGIVSFVPELDVDVSMTGSGDIDGQFTVDFESRTYDMMTTNAPPALGTFGGSSLQTTYNNAGKGKLSVSDTTYNTIFGINFVPEARMNVKVNSYGTNNRAAGATFAVRAPHAIRVVGNSGTGKPAVLDAPQQFSSDVVQQGTIQDGWDDGTTHVIGKEATSFLVLSGGDAPNPRSPSDTNEYAIFGDRQLVSCSKRSSTTTLLCDYDLGRNDSLWFDLDPDTDPQNQEQRRHVQARTAVGEEHSFVLEKRGSKKTYVVQDIRSDATFDFETPPYPSGGNGRNLDAALPGPSRQRRYAVANPQNCTDATITDSGNSPEQWTQIDADHPIDRSIIPNEFLEFVQRGSITTEDEGLLDPFRTTLPTWTFSRLESYFARDHTNWPAEERARLPADTPVQAASSAVANALGSRTNPNNMVNLEANLNTFKGLTYTRRGEIISGSTFTRWNTISVENAKNILKRVRSAVSEINYLNNIVTQRRNTLNDIRAQLVRFDRLYAQATGRTEALAPLHDEFWREWERWFELNLRQQSHRMLDSMRSTWQLALDDPNHNADAHSVLELIDIMSQQVDRSSLDRIYQ